MTVNVTKSETKRDFNADRAIIDAATVGPWYVAGGKFGETNVYSRDNDREIVSDIDFDRPNDARFIAEARTGWPAALDEIERLRGVLERFDTRTHPMLSRTDMARIAIEALDGDTTRSTYFELRKLRTETQRYRQAFEQIIRLETFNFTSDLRAFERVKQIAKEALEHGER